MGNYLMDNTSPIRVLHVVTYMGRGGLETMLMNYYRHIDRNRIQFDFLVHRSFEADYDSEIIKLGGRIYHLPRLNPLNSGYLKQLDTFFEKHPEYPIVHVHQDCMSSVILKEAERCGVRVRIAHSHSSDQSKDIKYPIKLFYRRCIPKYATDLFACSAEAGNWMFCGAPFSVLKNAIDSEAFRFDMAVRRQIRERLHADDACTVIGHVGRFMDPKNHVFLIDVFSEIVKRKPNVKLLLVGDGPLRKQIADKVDALGLSDRVVFTGVRSDVAALMQAMDVLVFPSKNEGLPVTLVEAQAAGLLCVISDCIPKDAIITKNLVTTLSLQDSPERWAKHVLDRSDEPRLDHFEEVKAAGFDVQETAKWLEEFYLDKAKQ